MKKLLSFLSDTVVPDDCELEILVVDNNSKDDTAEVVQKIIPTHPQSIRYIFHEVMGVSGARNAGIKNATGDIIMFTDDDCIPDQEWIAETIKLYVADEELHMIGGRIELYRSEDLPETIKTSLEPDLLNSIYKVHAFLHGCNMSVKRSALDLVGFFDEALGKGTALKSAEDTDLVYRFFKAGMRIIYAPEVMVYHDHGRSTAASVQKVRVDYKLGRGAFYIKNLLAGNWNVLQILFVQLRPPVRQWLRGPNRLTSIRKYIVHAFTCLFLVEGAYKFLRNRMPEDRQP